MKLQQRSGTDVDVDAVLDPESAAIVERLRLEYRQRPVDRHVALHVAEIQKAAQAQPADHLLDRSILIRVAAVAVVVAVGSIAFMVTVARSAPANLQADLASDGFRTGEAAPGEGLTDERRDLIGADRIAGGIDGRSSSPDADAAVGDAGPVPSSTDDQPAATSIPTVDDGSPAAPTERQVDDSKGLDLSAPVSDSATPTTSRSSSGQPTVTTSPASGQPPSSQARSTASSAPAPAVTAPPSAPAPTSSTTSSMTCNGRPATIVGTNSADVLTGTPGPDVIYGGSGNDVIYGLGGNDTICGGNGKDDLRGGDGDDYLYGGNGKDRLVGGDGVDVLDGGNGKDELIPDHP